MKQNKGMQLSAVLAVILIVSMAFVPAVSAVPTKNENESTSCGCAENGGCNSTIGDLQEIKGSEKDKWVDKALKDNSFKEIAKQLKKEGFIQQDSQAYIAPVENEDGLKTDILYVTTSYRIDGSEEGKTVLFVHNPKTEASISLLVDGVITIQGFTTCSLYLASCLVVACLCCIPCAAVFVPPLSGPAAWACLKCIAGMGFACYMAYCECSEYMCDEGFDDFCDNCP